MQLIPIAIGIIGLGMFLLGIKWMIISMSKKDIINFNINDTQKEFKIEKEGFFSICIIGGGYVDGSNGFRIIIENTTTSKKIYPTEKTMKYRFRKNWKLGVEFSQFKVNEPGKYLIVIQNIQSLIIKPSMLRSKRFFQKKLSTEFIEVLIKESTSTSKKILSIVFLIVGGNMTLWGFVLTFMPEMVIHTT